MERYTHEAIHRELVNKWHKGDGFDEEGATDKQALFCAYYVPLVVTR